MIHRSRYGGHVTSKFFIFILMTFLLVSCKAAPVKQAPSLTVTQQEELAMKKFREILDSTKELKRQDAVPLIMNGYDEVIEKYPDSYLAEESYYRKMSIYLLENYPPMEKEAEDVYREYFSKYKKPRMGMAMNGDLARYYYNNQKWEKLARFTTPFMREYVRTGKYGDTVFLFLYTEAKFYLKDYEEARKGYQIIKKNFAGKPDARNAEQRIEYINSILESKKGSSSH